MSGLPSASNPTVFVLALCQAQHTRTCVLSELHAGNPGNWYFSTWINGTQYAFAPFGGRQSINGVTDFECQGCSPATYQPYLEVSVQHGHVSEWGVFEQGTPVQVTPEPSTALLVASGLIMTGRRLLRWSGLRNN